ncbi:colanic acid biosynthesis acetyltransferase WcaF [Salinimonas marina]|uniref:Colanic acid biosynthesis acetyltransferase WcaF n=1 Tax=Salinimonas marina TaxID=2785918 RepID=A0A7S9DWR3_9ALTE|nr:putative colanic acid biosynthesis acetyltransferase [Salinimonas marina]QPG05133.1 colanic acid biosynthesis acetyltransferase WcaF [Salinimonas marina]
MQRLDNFKLPEGFRCRTALFVQIWWFVQTFLFRPSPQFAYSWRRFLLRLFGAKIGKNVIIRPSATITYPWNLTIGDFSWVGDDVVLYNLGPIEIGSNAVVSQRSYLCTGSHDYKSEAFDIHAEKIVVKDKAWIATDVFVAPGVVVNEGAVVGARSSVFEDMPANMICVGYPAKPIKPRMDDEDSNVLAEPLPGTDRHW